ncbi:MAG: hypothetical protein V3W04_09300 [Gammaproteobacteria bacterium]
MKSILSILLLFFLSISLNCSAQSFSWLHKVESQDHTDILEIASFADAIYAAGRTECGFPYCKGILIKLSKDGIELWRREVITYSGTEIFSIAVNENAVYVAGRSEDSVPVNGFRNPPASFVKKYDHDGNLIWTYIDSEDALDAFGIALDADGLYTIGQTLGLDPQGVVSRISFEGHKQWAKLLGSGTLGGTNIIVEAGIIYASSDNGRIFVYSTDGSYIKDFPIEVRPILKGLSLYQNHLYISGFEPGIGDAVIKIDLAGNQIWKQEFFGVHGRAEGIATTESGVYVGGNVFEPVNAFESLEYEMGTRLVHYDFNGNIKHIWTYPQLNIMPYSITATSNQIYFGGIDFDTNNGFIAQFSSDDLLPPAVLALDDINSDSIQDIAILRHNYGAGSVRAVVKDTTGVQLNEIMFDSKLKPIDFDLLADSNANAAPELVVLGTGRVTAEVRDSLSGEKLSTVLFNSSFTPINLTVMPDLNGNGTQELAVLGKHPTKNWVLVDIRDSITGSRINSVSFNPNFIPVQLSVLQDIDNNGTPDLAVLSNNKVTGQPDKIEIRNLEGTLIRNTWIGKAYDSVQMHDYTSHNGNAMLAVLQIDTSRNRMHVARINIQSGTVSGITGFNGHYAPAKLSILSDLNGNHTHEFAIFGKNPENDTVKIEVRDTETGTLINNTWLWKEYLTYDMTILPSLNGNSSEELYTVVRRFGYDNLRTYINDGLDGAAINVIDWY